MPFQTSLSLSIELAKVFPVREVLTSGAEQLANLVRALKRNGSDFLVEEDLADIFGRGKIEPSLENDFRDVVKTGSFQPLHANSSIALDAGPGPTLCRALKERFYMSCVIQLSFLVWMHEETTLAAMIMENMLTRYESDVKGATPDPDYDGILKTLQSLPEDRLVVVESQMGLIPMVIWAHYILGLNVLIKNSPDGDVAFGRIGNPQVIIKWSSTFFPTGSLTNPDNKHWFSPPIIYLLDADMNVQLETKPNHNVSTEIGGQEFHRLKGYGTTFLRRLFNRQTLVADDDPIFADTANLAVSFSILLSRAMRRVPLPYKAIRKRNEDRDVPKQCYFSTEHWRLFDSSDLLFRGIKLDKRKISEYLEESSGKVIDDMAFPTSIRNYLQKLDQNTFESTRRTFLVDIKGLASWILSFAQVVDVESCADLPLRIAPQWMYYAGVLHWNGLDPIDIESDIWFKQIMKMMRRDINSASLIVESQRLFLTCHNGWSLFYSCVGDYDPGEINCELLSIKRGVPTNTRTGERKYRILDAPLIEEDVRAPKIIEKGGNYCFAVMDAV
ncbi:MAG: hypothetical protein Q9201_000441 [Fulgogasparrea decipioides]